MSSFVHTKFQERAILLEGVPVLLEVAEHFVTPELNTALGVWREKRGVRVLPERSAFSMRELKGVLRNMALLEISGLVSDRRYFVRYMGSELDNQLTPMTGKYVDDVLPSYFLEKWTTVWSPSIDSRMPMRSISRAEFQNREYCLVEAIYLPLGEDGLTPNMLLTAVFYHQVETGDEGARRSAQTLLSEFNQRTGTR